MKLGGSSFVVSSNLLPGLRVFVIVCVATLGLPEGATQVPCDPAFKEGVEGCLSPLQGFPVMTRRKIFVPGDWDKTNVICKWLLVPASALCVDIKFSSCPQSEAIRSVCGFQGLDTDLLLQYGDTVCRHRQVLQQHSTCMNRSQCVLESCLKKYEPIMPTGLTLGLWQTPLYWPQCRYHAYAEYCYQVSLLTRSNCHVDLYNAHMDILNLTRPAYCAEAEMEHLREMFANGVATSKNRWQFVVNTVLGSVMCLILVVLL